MHVQPYEGSAAAVIGSTHTPGGKALICAMGLAVQSQHA
jgi:hypothetical protein